MAIDLIDDVLTAILLYEYNIAKPMQFFRFRFIVSQTRCYCCWLFGSCLLKYEFLFIISSQIRSEFSPSSLKFHSNFFSVSIQFFSSFILYSSQFLSNFYPISFHILLIFFPISSQFHSSFHPGSLQIHTFRSNKNSL